MSYIFLSVLLCLYSFTVLKCEKWFPVHSGLAHEDCGVNKGKSTCQKPSASCLSVPRARYRYTEGCSTSSTGLSFRWCSFMSAMFNPLFTFISVCLSRPCASLAQPSDVTRVQRSCTNTNAGITKSCPHGLPRCLFLKNKSGCLFLKHWRWDEESRREDER